MKTLIISAILLAAASAQALPIRNFHVVNESNLVLRGAQPLGKAEDLKEAGVEHVLIFKTDTKGEVEREISELLEAGFEAEKIHHLPMAWKELDLNEACEQTIEALKIIANAERNQQPIFFHCTAGEDRTGMLAGLYRMVSEGISRDEAFQEELCGRGYSDGNPNKPAVVTSAIEQGLTPLFMALAEKIESKQIGSKQLSKRLCQGLKIDRTQAPTCR